MAMIGRLCLGLVVDRLDIVAAVHLNRALAVREDAFGPSQHQDHQRQPENPEFELGQINRTEKWTDHGNVDCRGQAVQHLDRNVDRLGGGERAGGLQMGAEVRASHQVRAEARRDQADVLDHVRRSPDTTVKAALFEDSAALAGLVLAAAGLLLQQLTGSPVWDGGASIAIGVLLFAVAVRLGLDSRDLLIGRAAGPRELGLIRDEIERTPGVDALLELLTMHLGPDHLIVAARVAFGDELSADRAEDLADDIDRRLAERLPLVPHVFIDPTQAPEGGAKVLA